MIKEWELEINKAKESKNQSIITRTRGRIINKIKREIKNLKKKNDNNSEDIDQIKKMEEYLELSLDDHKNQLSSRYRKEFIDKEAKLHSIVTVLPKALVLSIKKINTCINELKEAKTNKEKFFGSIEVLKSLGIVVATPGILATKLAVKYWYIIFILLLPHLLNMVKLPNRGKEKEFKADNLPQEQEEMVIEEEMRQLKKLYKPFTSSDPVKDKDYNPLPKQWDMQYIKQGEDNANLVNNGELVLEDKPKPIINKSGNEWDIQYLRQKEDDMAKTTSFNFNDGKLVLEDKPKPIIKNSESEWDMQYIKQNEDAMANLTPIVQDSTEASKEHLNTLYDIMKYKYNEQMGGGLDIYNSYDDALNKLIEQGSSHEEAVEYLNDSNKSIRWLVDSNGKGIFENETDMIDYLKSDEILGVNLKDVPIDQYVETHKTDIVSIVDQYKASPDLSTFIKTAGPEALGLFILYEIIQYGLAVPTGGLSLALPF